MRRAIKGWLALAVLAVTGRVGRACVRIEMRLTPLTPGYLAAQIDPADLPESGFGKWRQSK